MKNKFSSTKGITLIALIVTIVVMILLIGITISGIKGNEGIVNKTKSAKNTYTYSQIKEKVDIYELKHPDEEYDVTDMIVDKAITIDEAKQYYKKEGSINPDKIISIKTAEDLAKIGVDSDYPLDGYYILENDIDLSSICSESKGSWTPIANYGANYSNIFTGVFNGNDCNIKGLYINTEASLQALFGGNSGTIKNIKMTDGQITGKTTVASVVARNWGLILNCSNNNPINSDGASGSVGGVVAASDGVGNKIKDCYNLADIHRVNGNNVWTSGVLGRGDENTIIENCYNRGNITTESAVAGITGGDYIKKVNHCYNTGNLRTSGLNTTVGIAKEAGEISYCYNTGKIVNTADTTCGAQGISRYANVVMYCYNIGDIEGYQNVAGVTAVGRENSIVEYCYNSGNVKANNYTVGGIMAWVATGVINGRLSNCYNTGKISASGAACGGILGNISNQNSPEIDENIKYSIFNCYNIGDVESANRAGAIIGGKGDRIERNINNNFYLEGSCQTGLFDKDVEGKVEPKTEEYFTQDESMQTSITYLLNSGNGDNSTVWERKNGINNGYPYLKGMEPK